MHPMCRPLVVRDLIEKRIIPRDYLTSWSPVCVPHHLVMRGVQHLCRNGRSEMELLAAAATGEGVNLPVMYAGFSFDYNILQENLFYHGVCHACRSVVIVEKEGETDTMSFAEFIDRLVAKRKT